MANVSGCWGYGTNPCFHKAYDALWRAMYALRHLQFSVLEECTRQLCNTEVVESVESLLLLGTACVVYSSA